MPKRLVIIGGGPKALALLAKRAAVAAVHPTADVPEIIVVEKHEIAANWRGSHGYTDGAQSLVSPPEKDIGFPYRSESWGDSRRSVMEEMLRFSWHRYKAIYSRRALGEWLDRDRQPPVLEEWASYLLWVAHELGYNDVRGADWYRQGTVPQHGIRLADDGRWVVRCEGAGGPEEITADGVVITGPGEARRIEGAETMPGLCFNCSDFWRNQPVFAGAHEALVGVIGNGLTAAPMVEALLSLLRRRGKAQGQEEEELNHGIVVITNTGMVYSRGEGYFETRIYGDPNEWRTLSEADRADFLSRNNRAVFSVATQQKIKEATQVNVMPLAGVAGDKEGVLRVGPDGAGGVSLDIAYGGHSRTESFAYLIDGRNLNRVWFLDLLSPALQERVTKQAARVREEKKLPRRRGRTGPLSSREISEALSYLIGEDLALAEPSPHRLHLPMLADMCWGPGIANLHCLGLLSDRILRQYVAVPAAPNAPG